MAQGTRLSPPPTRSFFGHLDVVFRGLNKLLRTCLAEVFLHHVRQSLKVEPDREQSAGGRHGTVRRTTDEPPASIHCEKQCHVARHDFCAAVSTWCLDEAAVCLCRVGLALLALDAAAAGSAGQNGCRRWTHLSSLGGSKEIQGSPSREGA